MSSNSDSTSDNSREERPLSVRGIQKESAFRPPSSGSSRKTSAILRLEALVLFAATLLIYHMLRGSWLVFVLLLLAFDISMIGYAKSNKLGAITYNLGHTLVFPVCLALIGYSNDIRWLLLFSLIWLAHINMDRALGYGLKHASFHHTHLGTIGKK